MRHCRVWSSGLIVLAAATAALAHDVGHRAALVIDTDVGLDDAVTLAMALQSPQVDISAIVACEGVADLENGVQLLERMLDRFNRRDIPLYAAAGTERSRTPPPFRPFAMEALRRALPAETASFRKPFAPDAYTSAGEKVIVLALGPLTNLAAALREGPEIGQGIQEVIIAGAAEPDSNWNIRFDPEAMNVVQSSGIALKFVFAGSTGRKPDAWPGEALPAGQKTSVGESFFDVLLADPRVREHYTQQLGDWRDELAFLYIADPTLFVAQPGRSEVAPVNRHTVTNLFIHSLSYGRQQKARVVFAARPFPDHVLCADVRERKSGLISKNGKDEWDVQLLTNELHDHLGAYSVIGAKMGLRAAELLNARRHDMRVLSHSDASPPISCMNDGVIVATGCTPGRGLFDHVAGPPGSTKVTFEYNGRRVTLALKEEFQQQIAQELGKLGEASSLDQHEYWDGVRRLGLDIWENWHRRDLFEIVDSAAR